MKKYNHLKTEKHWQKIWEKENLYRAEEQSRKIKKYVLVEFPYPSGEGLHLGHLRPYVAGDVYARYKRMKGEAVLYPMGWDAFGLPAENFALKQGIHPKITTARNIKNAKKQLQSWGMSFDWSREINTTDPAYYRWTQWIFLQFFKAGLAYQTEGDINWCPSCKTGLANEEVIEGRCERCGTLAERKKVRQWYLKITAYAEKLLAGLKKLNWPEAIKKQQENWIGRSEGAVIKFKVKSLNLKVDEDIEVFTTRADTLFGATYLVIAPEHNLISKFKNQSLWSSSQIDGKEVGEYVEKAWNKSEIQRTDLTKEKTGVELRGIKAVNPANGEEIPVWVADYVLSSYGTGAIMAVPAHDQRDFEFAQKYRLPIKVVIQGGTADQGVYEGEGKLINSRQFSGLNSEKAKKEITEFVGGKKQVQYKLRDWVFSRQRYWGEPIPIIHCGKCGAAPVPEKDLPVKLPEVKKYQPTGTGESPLVAVENWVKTKCPQCQGPGRRETNTMPQWAGSSWYYLRYLDSKNKKQLAAGEKMKYWLPVDVYFGGLEHTTLHLLYSRFWHLFLYDQKLVPAPEPYTRRVPHGIVLAADGEKMSKSRGNVVNPDEIVKVWGADVLRMYEMFLGPHEEMVSWNDRGIMGIKRFLERIWKAANKTETEEKESKRWEPESEINIWLNQTIKKVSADIENCQFNTAISALMILARQLEKAEAARAQWTIFIKLLAPFAPHLTEEIWRKVWENRKSIQLAKWPDYDSALLEEKMVKIVVQINGKTRAVLTVRRNLPEEEARKKALASDKIEKHLTGKTVIRMVYVKNRLINVVTRD